LKYFFFDIDATTPSKLTGISRNSINKIFNQIRVRIAEICEDNNIFSVGAIELDESYFGGKRKGKRCRGASGKTPVFGMLKRCDKVYTQIVKNCTASELIPIIEEFADKESVIFSDGFKSYDGLVDYGYKEHFRVKHSDCFADGNNHINGIENFWGLCKVRLTKFRGIRKTTSICTSKNANLGSIICSSLNFLLHFRKNRFRYNLTFIFHFSAHN